MPGHGDPPTVSLSFANNFWGKEDAGVQPLLERMHNAKTTCDELKSFYNARASIEDEYAKKMIALCRKPLGSSESGTLRASLDVMRGEVEGMGKAHQQIAGQMKSELEEPLGAFSGGMKERRKIVQSGVEKLFKTKQQQTQTVNKSRDRYEQECLKIKGYLAQGHMVMGQEERKNKAKMEKTQIQLASTSNEYESAVKALEETTGRWNRDWKAACDKFQDLEEERLDFMKSSLWTFANVASTVCVSDDASCEKIRLSLENCEVEKDISGYIRDRGTGQEIPDPPRYINFCRGDIDDAASAASGEEGYSVAQFQRTVNPAYRSSSPQPSAFESHMDPEHDLASRMGHMDTHGSPTKSGMPQKPDDLPPIPHNEFPENGMTMFCRTAPPSDRSSAPSPFRPSSRDSQSEYSNPTSFDSQEPAHGKESPSKFDAPQTQAEGSPSKNILKKKSGFFSNSPFRRKSKYEKDTSSNRTSWMGGNSRGGPEVAMGPPKFGVNRGNGSHSPEPVDPRANFQLNVGPNVFDVASPDAQYNSKPVRKGLGAAPTQMDPIAAALEELKGVNKQSSTRVSADRYAGMATPGPPSAASTQQSDFFSAGHRNTPPPSYHDPQPMSRLGAPQPAFTSAEMQSTTRKYVNQTQEMYGTPRQNVPRATSPRPMRSTSPRPGYYEGRENQGLPRSASPNPYGGSAGNRHRQAAPNASPTKYGSPNEMGMGMGMGRVPSPQPHFARQERPHSSGNMAIQLADGGAGGRTPRHRADHTGKRPATYYGGGGPGGGQPPMANAPPGGPGGAGFDPQGQRMRSKSVADGRKFNAEGRPILQFARAMYMYRAAIPEELSFAKGDVLAVLRYQDDGWWEAEVAGKRSRPGLVPSNYVQPC